MRTLKRIGWLWLILLLPVVASAQSAPTPLATVEGVSSYRLGNGVQVLLLPDSSRPLITVSVTYFVGSRHEGQGEAGVAHLLEHLLFGGTDRHPNIPAEFAERGAFPNGTTSFDRTNYFTTIPASEESLRWLLDLESDRMRRSPVTAEALARELGVIQNERDAAGNSAGGVLTRRVFASAFQWHEYSRSPIGSPPDLARLTPERVGRFYDKYYQPDNLLVVLAGEIDPIRALELLESTFGSLPMPNRTGYNTLSSATTPEPPQDGERSVVLRGRDGAPASVLAWHVPAASHPDAAVVEVLAQVLGAPGTGRLFRSIGASGVAGNITASPQLFRDPGLLIARAELRRGDDPRTAVAAMVVAAERLQKMSPATAEEVERGKAELLNRFDQKFADPAAVAMELSEWGAIGDWRLFFVNRDRIRSVTLEDVQRVASSYLRRTNLTTGIFLVDSLQAPVRIPAAGEITRVVEGYRGDPLFRRSEAFELTPENLDARTIKHDLPNGLSLGLLQRPGRSRLVSVRMALRFGSPDEPFGRAASVLAGQILMRGTVDLDRRQLGDALASLGARVNISGSQDRLDVNLSAPRTGIHQALELLFKMLRQSRFDPADFELLRQAQIAALDRRRSDPEALALATMQRLLSPFAPGHQQAPGTLEEQLTELGSVTLEQVRQVHNRLHGASLGEIAVVGDFDPDTVRAVLLSGLSGWESLAPFRANDISTSISVPGTTSITIAGKPNAVLAAGRLLPIDDQHHDYPALVLADYLLGGGLSARLASRLRLEEGLSYRVRSFFSARPEDSFATWVAVAIHAPEARESIEAGLMSELSRAGREGFSAEELARAKAGWLAASRSSRVSDGALAQSIVTDLRFGRNFADLGRMETRVLAVTRDELRGVVTRYLLPDSLTVVRVGDFSDVTSVDSDP